MPGNSESILPIKGIRIGVAAAGIRYRTRDDIVVMELAEGTTTAATFTRNRFAAAPVQVAQHHLGRTTTRFLLINAGNANAGTGQQGYNDCLASCAHLAEKTGRSADEVLPFSTGVIGVRLPIDKMCSGIDKALESLDENHWQEAAAAILTTDTRIKTCSHEFTLNAVPCRITGIAKGSGMIHPDMATMLAFIGTDATVPAGLLQAALQRSVNDSFNCITVDGDTSTNDACVACATGQGNAEFDKSTLDVLVAKLTRICRELAEMIVRDGEGASKFIRIHVENGIDTETCRAVGYTVAQSPLVKTAFFGEDPNWGRILAAVGRAPVDNIDITNVDIHLDEVCVIRGGEPDPYYLEEDGARIMKRKDITVRINLNAGDHSAEILTCDLSHDYVSINADYRS